MEEDQNDEKKKGEGTEEKAKAVEASKNENTAGPADGMKKADKKEKKEKKTKKESREQLQAIRKIVQAEVPEGQQGQSSTLLNKVAKRLLRLSVGTLLFGGGEALSLPYNMESNVQCFV